MCRVNDILNQLIHLEKSHPDGISATDMARALDIDRSTASRYLNELAKDDKAIKIDGRPVKYKAKQTDSDIIPKSDVIGASNSLHPILEQGMAAFLYPSKSLPILLTGETGTGKTYLAETLSKLAMETFNHKQNIPFIVFNCADYAQNAELLVGQIFGIKEGAFTGATEDQVGLVEQANGGILFLDEIHRLPPSGQEMLFYLMDKGVYRRLGEATQERQAQVTLIGATTEEPNKALLPTLVRRFSVKLNLPPLRERTTEERNELINYFLSDEAAKMKTELAITEDSRQAFLTYRCPGNIGQLKSDIQIACARAYLRFLQGNQEQVLIKTEDLPNEVAEFLPHPSELKPAFQTIHAKQVNHWSDIDFPNIYERLNTATTNHHVAMDEDRMKHVIHKYIRDLSEKYRDRPDSSEQGWQQLIDKDLFQALKKVATELKENFPVNIDLNQIYVIGLHLQNFRDHQLDYLSKGHLPVVIHPNVTYRQAANYLASYLKETINMILPKEEIELIAHFLTSDHEARKVPTEQNIAVILVTHGNTTATSMADVTNTLLGNQVIHAVDMPLNVSASDTYEHVKQKIKNMTHLKGVLLLVDIGSLITMGDAIKHDVNVPIKTLSSVNLPMVLEAGRKSLISDTSLDAIYHDAKKAMVTFLEKDTDKKDLKKKRLIATVCFTGDGAAQLLEKWIEDQLSTLDQDVIIRAVRIDPTTKDTTILNDLTDYYDVISIIGTVPVSIEGVPYIPAWELLQDEGISRMLKLLEVTRQTPSPIENQDIEREEIFTLIAQGLGEIVTFINPKEMATILDEYIPPIRKFYNWDTNRELGMWMHIGSLIDRMVAARMKQSNEQFISSIPVDRKTTITKEDEKLWSPLFTKIENTFHINFSSSIKKELIKLSL